METGVRLALVAIFREQTGSQTSTYQLIVIYIWGRRKSHHGNLPRRLPVAKQNKILGFLGGHPKLDAKTVDEIRPCSWCSRSTREPPHRYTAPRNTLAPGSPAGSPQAGTCSPAWIAKTHCSSVAPKTLQTDIIVLQIFIYISIYIRIGPNQ